MDLDLNRQSQVNKPKANLDTLVLPVVNLKTFSFAKEQISNSSKLIAAVLPSVVENYIMESKKQDESISKKIFLIIKETVYNTSLKVAKFLGLESFFEKTAEYIKNIFKSIANVFATKNLLEENNKTETNFAKTLSDFSLNSIAKNAFTEEKKNDCGPYRGLIGLESFKKIEQEKKKEEQALVNRLIRYGGKAIDQAEKAYLKLALTLNHFRNPELAKIEKLIVETEKS